MGSNGAPRRFEAKRGLGRTVTSQGNGCAARARQSLGALGDAVGALREWRAICRLRIRFEMENADWFYLPSDVEEDPRFWTYLLQIPPDRHEFSGWWPNSDALNAYFSYELLPGKGDEQSERSYIEQRRAVLAFELARTSKDLEAGREMLVRYPDWEESQELVAELSAASDTEENPAR